uniref:Uncharacterized protein n=1 Tax=Hyaloperonospora arabidopsidis (strain Emoy2) TaxID=559515 RepID=M4C4G3_HYAAE
MANRTLNRLGEEMKKSRWIQLFSPRADDQATWVSLGSKVIQPLNSMSLEQLSDNTAVMLQEMITSVPPGILNCCWQISGGIRDDDEVEAQDEGSVRIGRQKEVARPAESSSAGRQYARGGEISDATSRLENHARCRRTWSSEHAATRDAGVKMWNLLEDGRDAVLCGFAHGNAEAHAANYRNSKTKLLGGSWSDNRKRPGQVMEIRTHAPLDKIAKFEGKRHRSEGALQRIKRFTCEMKGTCQPHDE